MFWQQKELAEQSALQAVSPEAVERANAVQPDNAKMAPVVAESVDADDDILDLLAREVEDVAAQTSAVQNVEEEDI